MAAIPRGRTTSRRALLGAALGALRPPSIAADGYAIVARWPLPQGLGLFVATAPDPTPAVLQAAVARLRERFQAEANLVVQVFDDAEAAAVVRAGSRTVGEARFAAALAHQRASYQRSAARHLDRLTLHTEPPQHLDYHQG